MKDKRFDFGVAVSAIWILVMAGFVYEHLSSDKAMAPNEWGDFFAGFFAPLAFLWLVLGYLQQGEELRLSTEALRLQAEELKNSVDQQRELVEVTRQQVESEREALRIEVAERRRVLKPLFRLDYGGGGFNSDGYQYTVYITNAGNIVLDVVVTLSLPGTKEYQVFSESIFDGQRQKRFLLWLSNSFPETGSIIQVSYRTSDGESGSSYFEVTLKEPTPNNSLRGLIFNEINPE